MARMQQRAPTATRHLALRCARASGVGLCLALLLLAQSAGAQVEEERDEPLAYGLERVLVELDGARTIRPEDLLEALVVAGPRALPELREALQGTQDEERPAGSAPPALTHEQAASYEVALTELPPWVATYVNPTAEASPLDILRTRLALEVLESGLRPGGCAVALALASPDRPDVAPQRLVVQALETTLTSRLKALPHEARELAEAMQTVHPNLREPIVRSIGRAPSREAADFLTQVMVEDPSMDLLVLPQLARVLAVTHDPADATVELRVSVYLDSNDATMRREACLAAGRLELFEVTPQLIDLLEDDEHGVRANATWALERVTGKSMRPELWRGWYTRELAWWNDEAGVVFTALREGPPQEVSAAIRTLSGHRHFRHQIAEALAHVLVREEGSLVSQACAALEALRSGVATPALREALSHPSPEAREAARSALTAIRGGRIQAFEVSAATSTAPSEDNSGPR